VYRNTTGNAALATAGSGDVLTGILRVYWHSPMNLLMLLFCAYLHGLAADIALPETGHQSFIASDIINIWESIFEYYNKSPEKGLKKVYIFNSLNKSISSVSDGLGALNLQCCHLGRLE
jgi:hypothetical protein